MSNLPISEQYYTVALEHTDAEAAAQMLEETKAIVLSQYKMQLKREDPKLSDAGAETIAKSSPEWSRHIQSMVEARRYANICKANKVRLEMRHREWIAADANHRQGVRMT